jgi:RNA polymerase primary sigma factor
VEEVAEELGVPKKNWPLLKRTIQISGLSAHVSLDVLSTHQDTVEDPDGSTPEEETMTLDLLSRMSQLLETMDDREATILRLRYGLDEHTEPMTLRSIGEVVGLTRERVRQIEREALRKLYDVMSGEKPNSGNGTRDSA